MFLTKLRYKILEFLTLPRMVYYYEFSSKWKKIGGRTSGYSIEAEHGQGNDVALHEFREFENKDTGESKYVYFRTKGYEYVEDEQFDRDDGKIEIGHKYSRRQYSPVDELTDSYWFG